MTTAVLLVFTGASTTFNREMTERTINVKVCFDMAVMTWALWGLCVQVFVYHREMSTPIAQRLFSEQPMVPGAENAQFISAVCWKPNSHKLLAANSQGTIQIMELSSAASVEQDRMRRLHR
jgi:hypothetical protein